MRVGILTFHRAYNYGAVLQCYALQNVLQRLGHEVTVIDYRQPRIESIQRISLKGFIYHFIHISNFLAYIRKANDLHKKRKIFRSFSDNYLNISNTCYTAGGISKEFDCYVIGSDQLLNTDITNGIDEVYWGFFEKPRNAKLFSYAISGREDLLMQISDTMLKKMMNNFDSFSCREFNLSCFLNKYTSKNVSTCVDPTLLTNEDIWNNVIGKISRPKQRYIALYQVRNNDNKHKVVIERAKAFAKLNNFNLIDISEDVGVCNWLSLIKHADCVITTSFHATVFALIFNRPVYSMELGESADNRYVELLCSLGMSKSIKNYKEELTVIPSVNPNLQGRLIEYKNKSMEYLANALKGC